MLKMVGSRNRFRRLIRSDCLLMYGYNCYMYVCIVKCISKWKQCSRKS